MPVDPHWLLLESGILDHPDRDKMLMFRDGLPFINEKGWEFIFNAVPGLTGKETVLKKVRAARAAAKKRLN